MKLSLAFLNYPKHRPYLDQTAQLNLIKLIAPSISNLEGQPSSFIFLDLKDKLRILVKHNMCSLELSQHFYNYILFTQSKEVIFLTKNLNEEERKNFHLVA